MSEDNNFFGGAFVGGIAGLVIGAFGVIGLGGPEISDVKIFREEGKPTFMRIYRPGMDDILGENPGNKERFNVRLGQYLMSIKDQADREVEEARIKKQVEWYK